MKARTLNLKKIYVQHKKKKQKQNKNKNKTKKKAKKKPTTISFERLFLI